MNTNKIEVKLKQIEKIKDFFYKQNVYKQLRTMLSYLIPDKSNIPLELNIGGHSFTDGKKIVVGLPMCFIDKPLEQIFIILRALIGHEAQHINSSNFNQLSAYIDEISIYFNDKFDLPTEAGQYIALQVANIIEDGRIEKILGNKYKGYKRHLKFLNYCIWEEGELIGESELNEFLSTMTSLSISGIYPKGYGDLYVGTRLDEAIDSVYNLIVDGVNAITAYDCLELCKEILYTSEYYIMSLIDEMIENTANQQQEYEYTTSDEVDQNNPSNSTMHFKPEEKKEEKERSNSSNDKSQKADSKKSTVDSEEQENDNIDNTFDKSKENGKKDNLSKNQNETPEQQGSEGNTDEYTNNDEENKDSQDSSLDERGHDPGHNESENSVQSSDSDDSDNSEDGEAVAESSENSENDTSNSEQSTSTGEEDSNVESSNSDENGDNDSSSLNNSDSNENQDSINSKSNSNSSDSNEKENNEDIGNENTSPSDDLQLKEDCSNDSSKDKVTDSNESEDSNSSTSKCDTFDCDSDISNDGNDANQSEEDKKKQIQDDKTMMEDLEKEIKEEVIEEAKNRLIDAENYKDQKKKKDKNSELNEDDINKVKESYKDDMYSNFTIKKGFTMGHHLPVHLKRQGNRFRKEVEKIFVDKVVINQRNQSKGILSTNDIWRVDLKDYNVFEKNGTPVKTDYVAYLLGDGSGSMYGEKITHCIDALSILEEGLKNIIPFKSTIFNCDGYGLTTHHTIKEFNENSSNNYAFNFGQSFDADNGNKDGFSIRIATKELEKRSESKKILFILSDGLPSVYKNGEKEGMNDVKEAVKEARQKGIHVVALMFGTQHHRDAYIENYKYMYEKNIISCSPEHITNQLVRNIKGFLKR